MKPQQIAEAFSGHRFAETYDKLAIDVRWVVPGQASTEGREAVVAACNSAAAEMAQLTSAEFRRFVSVAGDQIATVDTIRRYGVLRRQRLGRLIGRLL